MGQKRVMKPYAGAGTQTQWYEGWEISDERRAFFRERADTSREAKRRALAGEGPQPIHDVNVPRLDPATLMPRLDRNGLRELSLFSGGGGLDLGFDLAGFEHVASFDILASGCETIRQNRPEWAVRSREEGDVTEVDWRPFRGSIDVLHGGPPCQPFSAAGRQRGHLDPRDMVPEFVRAVLVVRPEAFVMENVPALFSPKFEGYLRQTLFDPLRQYSVRVFDLHAEHFGVPQVRRRFFVVGMLSRAAVGAFEPPSPTNSATHLRRAAQAELLSDSARPCMGAREVLGLPDLGFDALAPTLRSTLTGPRHTTSVVSSVAAMRAWDALRIWPNGVAPDRERARAFVAENGHFRLSVPDIAVLQGFPEAWRFHGPVYQALGQIGNSVAPPVAYAVARSVAQALAASS